MEIPMYPDEDEDDIARSGHKRDLDAAKARIAELEAIESEQRVRISELKSETWAAAEINVAARSRIAELEGALRSCLLTCNDCGIFATWTACHYSLDLSFCDACAAKRKAEVHLDGRMVGDPVYPKDTWRRAKRNIELTRIYAPSTTTPSSTGERRE